MFSPETFDLETLSAGTVLLRLVLSAVCSAVLGLDRTHKRHAAGFRTYVLVCLGSCVAMMSGQHLYQLTHAGDPGRLGSQVISGIGFLGAGTIILSGSFHVRGLTTAAGIWATAAMGLAFGIGFYEGGLVVFILMFLVLSVFDRLQRIFQRSSRYIDLFVVLEDYYAMRKFFDELSKRGWSIRSFSTSPQGKNGEVTLAISVKMDKREKHQIVTGQLALFPGVILSEEVQE